MKKTFSLAVILCATMGVAAAGHAQTAISSTQKTTLVDLENQAKGRKKAKKATTADAKAASTDNQTSQSGQSGQTGQSGSQSGSQQQAPPASGDPDDKKIYKAGDIPESWKFKQEKDKDAKKAGTSGATTAPAPTASAPASTAAAPAPAAAAPAPAPATTASAPAAAPAPAPAATTTAPAAAAAPAPTPAPAANDGTAPTPAPAAGGKAAKQTKKPATARAKKPASTSSQNSWQDRGYISGNFGWQTASATFSDTKTIAMADGDPESRHLTANYQVKAGPTFDIGAGFRVWKNLAIGVAVSRASSSNDIAITGDVPHPFYFNTPRAVSGSAPGTREELGIHIDAAWVIPVNKKIQLAVFGGPSFINAKQTVVNDFTWNEAYPYDTATFASAVTNDESKTVTGFNIGADVGYFFNDTFGVGGIIRFSRGTLKSSIGDLDVGGPELAGGIRIRLRDHASSSPKPPAKRK